MYKTYQNKIYSPGILQNLSSLDIRISPALVFQQNSSGHGTTGASVHDTRKRLLAGV